MKIKRLLAFTLSMAMIVSMVPALVFADETQSEPEETVTTDTTETEEKETVKPEEEKTAETQEEPNEPEDKASAESGEEGKSDKTVEAQLPSQTDKKTKKAAASGNCGSGLTWT